MLKEKHRHPSPCFSPYHSTRILKKKSLQRIFTLSLKKFKKKRKEGRKENLTVYLRRFFLYLRARGHTDRGCK